MLRRFSAGATLLPAATQYAAALRRAQSSGSGGDKKDGDDDSGTVHGAKAWGIDGYEKGPVRAPVMPGDAPRYAKTGEAAFEMEGVEPHAMNQQQFQPGLSRNLGFGGFRQGEGKRYRHSPTGEGTPLSSQEAPTTGPHPSERVTMRRAGRKAGDPAADPRMSAFATSGSERRGGIPQRETDEDSGERFTFRTTGRTDADDAADSTARDAPAGSGAGQPPRDAGSEGAMPDSAGAEYPKSRDVFSERTVVLDRDYSGRAENRVITWWENIWWNYVKYLYTRDILVGKDRHGNYFTASWYFIRTRHEVRKCKRIDRKKRFQPYGALPTDCRLWEAWLRGWRNDPPTTEEEDAYRRRKKEKMGMHVVGDEEHENTIVRAMAHTRYATEYLQDLDDDQQYGSNLLMPTDQRSKEGDVAGEHDATWTAAFVRGDMFYNEEEMQNMRQSVANVMRDKEWQELEMKRQTRIKQPYPVKKPKGYASEGPIDPNTPDGDPMLHRWDGAGQFRTDGGVPMHQGIADLTTPELEKLRAECDALEDERVALRKELGLTNVSDWREGREPVDKGYDPFQPPPTTKRFKPQVWEEPWGVATGKW